MYKVRDIMKINCKILKFNGQLARKLKQGIYFHTSQLKEKIAFKIVIKYLRYSTDLNDMGKASLAHGQARNIKNAHHWVTKNPPNLFSVSLKPTENNRDILQNTELQHRIKPVEPHCLIKNSILRF